MYEKEWTMTVARRSEKELKEREARLEENRKTAEAEWRMENRCFNKLEICSQEIRTGMSYPYTGTRWHMFILKLHSESLSFSSFHWRDSFKDVRDEAGCHVDFDSSGCAVHLKRGSMKGSSDGVHSSESALDGVLVITVSCRSETC